LLDIAHVAAGDVFALALEDESQEGLAVALADACARRGALIDVICRDNDVRAEAQIASAVNEQGVIMNVQSYRPPDTYVGGESGVDVYAAYDEACNNNELRWNVAMCPTSAWAQAVYPERAPENAFRALGQDLLSFVRAAAGDGDDAWEQHMENLRGRARTLNERGVRQLQLCGPGTDLRLSVLEGAQYLPVEWETKHGKRICVNAPTEEIFTTPDPASVEGVFATSKPLMLAGESISHVSGRIVGGRIVELHCPDPRQEQMLQATFRSDPGLLRVGELGLVDGSSRIGERGRIYKNNIIDENAGTHLGFGQSYAAALSEEAVAAGVRGNDATLHIDLIIGEAEMDVTGIDAEGVSVIIIEKGKWVL
jgi:aminopeptidase